MLLDPTAWKDLNQRIDPAYRMPSYSVYLELVYEDLLASADVTLPPCSDSSTGSNSGSGSSSSSSSSSGFRGSGSDSGKTDTASSINGSNEDEGIGYCQGYNLVMTSQVYDACLLPNLRPSTNPCLRSNRSRCLPNRLLIIDITLVPYP